jgi:uncharacterized short protein YbdD (DUF466 family)
VLEEDYMDLRMFMRLLAMESEYKEWVEKQMAANPNQPPIFISEEMMNKATDPQVVGVRELTDDLMDLSSELQIYYISTPEANADYN